MSKVKRRLKQGILVILVVAVGLGGWFFYFIRVAPESALRRAESFAHRRMTVARLGEGEGYRFFFITNRRPDTTEGPIEAQFGTERDESLRFGHFDTRIEPTLGVGRLVNPSDWFINEEIKLDAVQSLDRGAFVHKVQALVQKSPYGSLLVVVHGFREAFPSALRKTAFLSHVLDINSPVLLFDWPGNQGSSLAGYRRAQQVAKDSGPDLADVLRLAIGEIRPERLWLIANSMGGEVVADAFSILYRDADFADAETEIEDVVLTAPDIGQEEFDEQFEHEISALARDFTVYVSSNDRALIMSRVVNRGRRRGQSTLSIRNPDQFEAAAAVCDLTDPESERVTLVDVTPINRTRNFHNFSLETPEFFDDLFLRLVNQDTPRSRSEYRVQTADGKVYWILTRAR